MNLIYVTAALPCSFDETFIVPEILEMQRRGHRVTVIPIKPLRPVFHSDARQLTAIVRPILSVAIVACAVMEMIAAPARVLRAAWLLASSRNLRILLKNAAVLPKGLWLARLARRHRIDHIHAHWAGTSATAALIASVVSRKPWSFTAHRWDISEDNILVTKARMAQFTRAIDVQGARELAELLGSHRRRLRIIHMGVALRLPSHELRPDVGGPVRVVLGARFVAVKGHRYALQAVARLKAAGISVMLDCVGHGPLQAEMERYARALDVLDRVEFPGEIDHSEFLNQLADGRWQVALLPSIETGVHREGIPVFLIEAMAAGIPVVSTNTGGIPELLRGGAGMLIPERDPNAIADALAMLVTDTQLRSEIAKAGFRRVQREFDIASTTSRLLRNIVGPAASAPQQSVCTPDAAVRPAATSGQGK